MTRVLGIETSCDETGIAVVEEEVIGRRISCAVRLYKPYIFVPTHRDSPIPIRNIFGVRIHRTETYLGGLSDSFV